MNKWSWLKEGADAAPVTRSDLDQLENYADRLFAKVGIDVEFTRHFLDRVNDERNQRQITLAELTRLFKQEFKRWGKKIAQLGPDAEAVMKDMKTDVNMPFVLVWDANNQELDLIAKTVMRKDNFKTSNPEFAIEDAGAAVTFFSQFNPEEIKQLAIALGVTIPVLKTMYYTVSGLNKIKKTITDLFGSKKKKGPYVIKKKHWSTAENKFTPMELAIMEGGHSIDEDADPILAFNLGLTESTSPIPAYLYKWVEMPQFQKYIDAKKLPVKRGYAHYIDQEQDFVKGNSFTDQSHVNSWTGDTLIRIPTSSINNKIYPVAGDRTYYKTLGMLNKFDPNAWKYESEEIDEYWVAGPVDLTNAEIVKGKNKIEESLWAKYKSLMEGGDSIEEAAGVGIIDAQNTTADVKPGETRRQAAKLGIKLNKDNEPPLLHAKATKNSQDTNKVAQLTERWKQLNEMDCKYGSYYCSTDRKVKCRQSPKKTRTTESALLAQQYQTKTLLNFLKKLTNAPVDVQLRKAIAKELASRGVKINEVEQIDVEKNDMGISPDLFQDALDGSGAAPTGDSVKNYAVARGEHGNTIYYFLLDGEKPFAMLKLVGAPGRGKMSMAMMLPEYQGKGVMPELYKLAIRDVGTIKSDVEQSAGGTAIWKRLAQDPDVVVYAYNEKSDEYAMVDDNLDSKFSTVNRAQDVKDLEAEETKELAHLLDLQLNGEIDREEYKRRVTNLRKAYEKEIVDTQDPGSVYFVATTTKGLDENFADGKKPGRKGLAKRVGVDCGKSVTALRKIAKNSSGEKQRMAHWCANMKSGRKKK